ncbi:GA-binding protein subunit beta-1-like isoform X1 [Periplaneta americana]|uniref:GA-binding protein subunit beta-1-like isoform X1 n=1 Tax=Periplaneta americana TaxID=6978 RepID=UPI0037E99647
MEEERKLKLEMEQKLQLQEETEAEQRYQEIVKLFRSVPGNDLDRAIAAAMNGNAAAMQFLIDTGIEVEMTDSDGKTLLHLASEAGHTDTVQVLLNAGKNAAENVPTAAGGRHAEDRKLPPVARAQVKKERVGSAPYYINPPLLLAARGGHLKVCELLLSFGTDVNTRGQCNMTALHFAARGGHLDVCELLVSKGADMNMKENFFYKTPLDMAISNGNNSIEEFLRTKQIQ